MNSPADAYAAALKRINAAIEHDALELSLDHLDCIGLREIPPLVSRLTSLYNLDLSRLSIKNLSPISHLNNLRSLSLSDNPIEDLRPISNLNNLEYLDIQNTLVVSARSLMFLTKLNTLRAQNTKINNTAPFSNLGNLLELNLGGTRIDSLSPLDSLEKIIFLGLDHTNIKDISPIANIKTLSELTIRGTKSLTDLRPLAYCDNLISTPRRSAGGLFFKNCGACDLDPEGLGELSEIFNDDERTSRTLEYLKQLKDWPPTLQSFIDDEPLRFFQDEDGRLEIQTTLPSDDEIHDPLKAILYEEMRIQMNALAVAAGNINAEIANAARAHLGRMPEEFAQAQQIFIYLALEWARGIYSSRQERIDDERLSPSVNQALQGIIAVGPGIVLDNHLIEKLELSRLRYAATVPPPENQIATQALVDGIVGSEAVFGDQARIAARLSSETPLAPDDRRPVIKETIARQAVFSAFRTFVLKTYTSVYDKIAENLAIWIIANATSILVMAPKWGPVASQWIKSVLQIVGII